MNRRHFLGGLCLLAGCRTESNDAPPTTQAAAPLSEAPPAEPPAQAEESRAERREQETPEPTVRLDVWHDIICPWCRLGCHRLDTALARWKGPRVEVVYHPFLLDPDIPPEGKDLRERLGAKYGPARVQSMFDRLSTLGAQEGVPFRWENVRISPPTPPAHAVMGWAPRERQRDLLKAIHVAYFERGDNIGDPALLGRLAATVGLPADQAEAAARDQTRLSEVRRLAAEASRQGIRGVPFFRRGDQTLSGAQPPDELLKLLG